VLKNEIGHAIGNFIQIKKIYPLGVIKVKIGPQSPTTEFGFQNQYGRAISIDWEFYIDEENTCF
jgi:hypothetical protein